MMALDQTNLKEFINYFEDTWLVGQFPPMLWNVFALAPHSPRRNNHLKGWHNKLKKITRKSHLNVFEIVKALNRSKPIQ